ncbi:MAG TPA: DNA translocase FtsK [Terriglobales bacterium]|nr:DNA translocase FtsK [Terriglobales bacterium]
MPLESHGDPRRLLSVDMEDRLMGWLSRAGGALLLAGVAAAWASLLTWSKSDPSLTHAAGGAPTNMLGAGGAIFADVMLNTLGFAAVFLLLAPMFWGIELMVAERIFANRKKTSIFPLSVFLLAGGFAALPVTATWPFAHSFGGIVGDWLYRLTATLFTLAGAERALPLAGLGYFLAGFAALGYSVGLEREDLSRLLKSSRQLARRRESLLSRVLPWREWMAWLTPALTPQFDELELVTAPGMGAFAFAEAGNRRRGHELPGLEERREPYLPDIHVPELSDPAEASEPSVFDVPTTLPRILRRAQQPEPRAATRWPSDDMGTGREAGFDESTDAESRAMAERFAPASAERPDSAASSLADEPEAARARKSALFAGLASRRAPPTYRPPPMNLLRRPAPSKGGAELSQTVLRGTARLLEEVLADFSVKGEVREIKPGPVVTLFELEPARGTKSSRVVALAEDIARSMSVTSARAAIVPGRNVIGIELPNVRRETVYLREIFESPAFRSSDAVLPLALGKSIGGEPIVADLSRMPHLLVAGTTGSGKSVGINALIHSLLFRSSPDEVKFILVDPKQVELKVYEGLPHLLTPVVTDVKKAANALNWAVREMTERYKLLASAKVRTIDQYNAYVRSLTPNSAEEMPGLNRPLPYIVIIIDELYDLMAAVAKDVETAIARLSAMARAVGIHLILATQRPSRDVITGVIKSNLSARLAFQVREKLESRLILDQHGAETLEGKGDMLFLPPGSGRLIRVHGGFLSNTETQRVIQYLHKQGQPTFDTEVLKEAPALEGAPGQRENGDMEEDPLYQDAVKLVVRTGVASASNLQRKMRIGYARAARLLDIMEHRGIVGPADGARPREIMVDPSEIEE